jgi:hypothetical protein
MGNVRGWLRVGALAAVAVLSFGWAPRAWAPTCPGCSITNVKLPLADSFLLPPNSCVAAGEDVSLTGEVNVVTVTGLNSTGGVEANIYLNMAGVSGLGLTTRNTYIGTGANKFVVVTAAPGSADFSVLFTLEPTDGCASVPLPLRFTLDFDKDGTLMGDSAVAVDGGN